MVYWRRRQNMKNGGREPKEFAFSDCFTKRRDTGPPKCDRYLREVEKRMKYGAGCESQVSRISTATKFRSNELYRNTSSFEQA